jgi:hypothetical protein
MHLKAGLLTEIGRVSKEEIGAYLLGCQVPNHYMNAIIGVQFAAPD